MYYVETNIMLYEMQNKRYQELHYYVNVALQIEELFSYLISQLAEGYPLDMCLIFDIGVLRLDNPIYVFCKNAAFLGSHLESVNSNYKKFRNGLLMYNAMRKVVLIDFLSQMVRKVLSCA